MAEIALGALLRVGGNLQALHSIYEFFRRNGPRVLCSRRKIVFKHPPRCDKV